MKRGAIQNTVEWFFQVKQWCLLSSWLVIFCSFLKTPIAFLAGWAMHGKWINSCFFPSVAMKNSHGKLDTEETLDCPLVVGANCCATQLFRAAVYLILKKNISLEFYMSNQNRSLRDTPAECSHTDLLIHPLMYHNFCMYLQSWNPHLIEITIFPWALCQKLLVASRDFGRFEGAKQRENARSHWEAGDASSSLRGLCWMAGQDLQSELPLPVIPMARNWDCSITLMIESQKSTTFKALWFARGSMPHRLFLWYSTQGKMPCYTAVMGRDPPVYNSDKVSPCFGLFDIPVCRWPEGAATHSAWGFLNDTSYRRHVKISNWICSARCNH